MLLNVKKNNILFYIFLFESVAQTILFINKPFSVPPEGAKFCISYLQLPSITLVKSKLQHSDSSFNFVKIFFLICKVSGLIVNQILSDCSFKTDENKSIHHNGKIWFYWFCSKLICKRMLKYGFCKSSDFLQNPYFS